MADSFLLAASTRALALERPGLGGRSVDSRGHNDMELCCPRCLARIVSCCGELKHRPSAILCVPVNKQRSEPASVGEEEGQNESLSDGAADGEEWDWKERPYAWWWLLQDFNDVDNGGLSRTVSSPRGELKLIMCCDCNYGPFGYQLENEPLVWLCCDLLCQQPAGSGSKGDSTLPPGLDAEMLKSMLESGMATLQFHVTFTEQRLGMVLANAENSDPSEVRVEVVAFTEMDGNLGPAEICGQVKVGDQVTRVNGRSTRGMEYADVLDMVIGAPRPVTIHFERRGAHNDAIAVPRAVHQEWVRPE
ncbi:MAG: hypothetical protein SGPRY_001403 [Prymnesium sp.]